MDFLLSRSFIVFHGCFGISSVEESSSQKNKYIKISDSNFDEQTFLCSSKLIPATRRLGIRQGTIVGPMTDVI